jgi:hypothetical protein
VVFGEVAGAERLTLLGGLPAEGAVEIVPERPIRRPARDGVHF